MPIYATTSDFAFSVLSDEALPELVIYVEDVVSAGLVSEALTPDFRSRVRIVPVGSCECILAQLAAFHRDKTLGNALIVLDGDNTYSSIIKRYKTFFDGSFVDKNESWFKEHYALLPGGCSPEEWLWNLGENDTYLRIVADQMGIDDIEIIKNEFSASPPSDFHDIFFVLSKSIGFSTDEIRNKLTFSAARAAKDEFKKINDSISNLLS
jgi:hypothetical protein